MSYYIKRIAVLRQTGTGFSMNGKMLSGLARAEKTGANVKLTVSLVNAAPVSEGEYYVAASGKSGECCFYSLGENPVGFTVEAQPYIEIEQGFSCLVCFALHSGISPVAFGCNGAGVSETYLKERLTSYIAAAPADSGSSQKTAISEESPSKYQDEIVATDNYYLYNDVDISNLSLKSSERESADSPELLRTDMPDMPEQEVSAVSEQDCAAACAEQESIGQTSAKQPKLTELFSGSGTFDEQGITQGNYFDKVKTELETIFNQHPREDALEKNIPGSKWVKIYYTDGKYYTVGLITDNKLPAYICYGVPGKYSKTPPEELKGFCSYLPLSLFDLKGDGYWMMYQNAKTGECVHIDFI